MDGGPDRQRAVLTLQGLDERRRPVWEPVRGLLGDRVDRSGEPKDAEIGVGGARTQQVDLRRRRARDAVIVKGVFAGAADRGVAPVAEIVVASASPERTPIVASVREPFMLPPFRMTDRVRR